MTLTQVSTPSVELDERVIPIEEREHRCKTKGCGRLLCKGTFGSGSRFEIKCSKCKLKNRFYVM